MSPLWLQIRVTCMLGVFLVLLFQWWNLPGSSDQASDEHREETRHAHTFWEPPARATPYKANCMYVNDQEVGC